MLDTCDRLTGTDTVGVVGVGDCGFVDLNELLQLTALLPGQSMAQVSERVALLVTVYNYSSGMSISEKQPHPERCGFKNISCIYKLFRLSATQSNSTSGFSSCDSFFPQLKTA